MRSWLTYIFLLMVACGTVLTSCSDVLDEEGIAACDDRAPVRLTISFGDSSPMSRDVDPGNDGTVLGPDYTTDLQKAMDADDVYLLVFDANTSVLKYQVKDLSLGAVSDNTYNTRILSGYMLRTATDETVKLVVLANLIQNKITVSSTNYTNLLLDSKKDVQDFIDDMIGQDQTAIYQKLIYNYNVTNNGTEGFWNISSRRIPMWGITAPTQVPSTGTTLDCYLYRAVAKVQIWVDKKNGLPGEDGELGTDDDFKITKITVQNANNKGYCVSLLTPNTSETVQYTAPSIPGYTRQDVIYSTFTGDQATKAFSDMIYLPEQSNTATGSTPVKLLVEYTYNGVRYTGDKAGVIEFKDSDTGQAFDVVRNHSYIFNITSVGAELGLTCVVQEWEKETEVWDFTENISESQFLNWGNQGLTINDAGEVIIPNTNNYTCTFGLLTPTDGTWQASLIPVGGVTDAFEFVGEHTGTISASGTGTVTLTIKAKYTYVFNENNAAKLRIVVRTKDGRTLVANLTGKEGFAEYTLVQNVNKRN